MPVVPRITIPATIVMSALLVGCSSAGPDAEDLLPTLVAEETLRIGSADDPETALTTFSVLEIGPDGRIYTIHWQDSEVRIRSPAGEPLGSFGGSGDGPGEFQSPSAIGFRDGEVWVVDRRAGRITWFDPDGEYLRDESVRVQASDDVQHLPPQPAGLLDDGTYYGSAPMPSHLIATGEITESATVRIDADGHVLDTLMMRPLGGGQLDLQRDGGALFTRQPFSDAPLAGFSRHTMTTLYVDRSVDAADPVFAVSKIAAGGDTLWSRELAYDPVPLPATAVDSFIDAFGSGVIERGFMTRAQLEDELDEKLYVPSHRTPVTRATTGRDGSVWLQLTTAEPDLARWWILESDGTPFGELMLSNRIAPILVTTGEIWGRALDELDIPYIVHLRVRPARSLEETD